jgi:hypothetical protein
LGFGSRAKFAELAEFAKSAIVPGPQSQTVLAQRTRRNRRIIALTQRIALIIPSSPPKKCCNSQNCPNTLDTLLITALNQRIAKIPLFPSKKLVQLLGLLYLPLSIQIVLTCRIALIFLTLHITVMRTRYGILFSIA